MKLFDTLKNIWKIEELKTRILTTLGLILVYRLGTEIVLPGIDPAGLTALREQTASNGVLGLLDMFSGGAFSNASIFALCWELRFLISSVCNEKVKAVAVRLIKLPVILQSSS